MQIPTQTRAVTETLDIICGRLTCVPLKGHRAPSSSPNSVTGQYRPRNFLKYRKIIWMFWNVNIAVAKIHSQWWSLSHAQARSRIQSGTHGSLCSSKGDIYTCKFCPAYSIISPIHQPFMIYKPDPHCEILTWKHRSSPKYKYDQRPQLLYCRLQCRPARCVHASTHKKQRACK